jgi:hypothetical protein
MKLLLLLNLWLSRHDVCPMHYKLLLDGRFVLKINCWLEMRGNEDKVVFVSCLQNGVLPYCKAKRGC